MKSKLVLFSLVVALLLLPLAACTAGPTEEEQRTEIEILSGRPAEVYTVLSYALASFINEDSDSLHATAIATGGTGDARNILIAETERRPTTMYIAEIGTSLKVVMESGAFHPQFLANMGIYPYGWVTFDENIKTLKDFAGKAVAGPRESPGWWDLFILPLKNAGVLDTVNLTATGSTSAMQALIDGTADIAWCNLGYIYPDKYEYTPKLEQAAARNTLYFPDWGEGFEIPVSAELGFPVNSLSVPAEAYGSGQPNPITIMSIYLWWATTELMDDDIGYEIAQIIYEQAGAEAFVPYHVQGAAILPATVPYGPWQTTEEIEEWYQPGALKFYRELGVSGL